MGLGLKVSMGFNGFGFKTGGGFQWVWVCELLWVSMGLGLKQAVGFNGFGFVGFNGFGFVVCYGNFSEYIPGCVAFRLPSLENRS